MQNLFCESRPCDNTKFRRPIVPPHVRHKQDTFVTVPVAPDVTVAVRVTLAPKVDGFSEEARVTVLDAKFTTWDTGVEAAPL